MRKARDGRYVEPPRHQNRRRGRHVFTDINALVDGDGADLYKTDFAIRKLPLKSSDCVLVRAVVERYDERGSSVTVAHGQRRVPVLPGQFKLDDAMRMVYVRQRPQANLGIAAVLKLAGGHLYSEEPSATRDEMHIVIERITRRV